MSKKRIRARIMWAYKDTLNGTKPNEIHGIWTYKSELHSESDDFRPIIVLPATAEAYEQMVEQIAITANREACGPEFSKFFMETDRNNARAALRAIGIAPPKKGRT